jgi:hypothetical protein
MLSAAAIWSNTWCMVLVASTRHARSSARIAVCSADSCVSRHGAARVIAIRRASARRRSTLRQPFTTAVRM